MPADHGRCHLWRVQMSEFPKMLYKGDKVNYSCAVAHTEKREQELRDIGCVDYDDLPEPEQHTTGEDSEETVLQSVYDQAVQDRARIENEFEAFRCNIDAMQARIDELKLAEKYYDWTVPQLQEELTKQGKTFKARDNKQDLIALLEEKAE